MSHLDDCLAKAARLNNSLELGDRDPKVILLSPDGKRQGTRVTVTRLADGATLGAFVEVKQMENGK